MEKEVVNKNEWEERQGGELRINIENEQRRKDIEQGSWEQDEEIEEDRAGYDDYKEHEELMEKEEKVSKWTGVDVKGEKEGRKMENAMQVNGE